MLRESTLSALLGAAIAGDPEVFGKMNEEEKKAYDGFVKDLEEAKKTFGDKFDEMVIDIPYSLEDSDDDDDFYG